MLAAALAVLAIAPLAGCAGGDGFTAAATPTVAATPATTASPGEVAIPDSPVGRQLRWFLDAVTRPPIAEDELQEHLSADFLAQVPPERFNTVLKQVAGIRVEKLTDVSDASLVALATVAGQKITIKMAVDGQGKIAGLLLEPADEPPPAPASWSELDDRLTKIAPDVGFLAAEVTRSGCRPVHTVAPDAPRPLGSMFKLYVLGAVAQRIREGGLSWDTRLVIRPELKSLPTGELQDRPDNSTVTVAEAAKLMISISDNTGTDLLIHKVGRRAVEAQVRKWSGHARLNVPFLTTREFFQLKGRDHPRLAEKYLSLGSRGRRDYLTGTIARLPLTGIVPWTEPRDIDTIEYFASPSDICRAYAGLAKPPGSRIGEVMSAGDGGLKPDRAAWPTVWFKGGSEPGVLTLGYLARTAKGRTYVVTAMAGDPETVIDSRETNELLALCRGAFELLKNG